MGVPSSGCLALNTNVQADLCSNIRYALGSPAYSSLCSLSIIAGKTAPHSMREFLSFCRETSYKQVGLCCIADTGYGTSGVDYQVWREYCICSNPAMVAGQCYTITLCHCLQASTCNGTVAIVDTICNSSSVYYCVLQMTNTPSLFSCSLIVRAGDEVCTVICAVHAQPDGGSPARSCVTRCAVSPTFGLFCCTGVQTYSVYSC